MISYTTILFTLNIMKKDCIYIVSLRQLCDLLRVDTVCFVEGPSQIDFAALLAVKGRHRRLDEAGVELGLHDLKLKLAILERIEATSSIRFSFGANAVFTCF
jgi:hypothetical protein